MKKYIIFASIVLFAFAVIPVFASSTVIYNNGITSPLPSNIPSEGPEAYAFNELGGQVLLADTARNNPTVTVMMSSWGCQSGSWFNHDCVTTPGSTYTYPITINVYNVNPDNSPGTLIKSDTQSFAMPYRPSADNTHCTGGDAGKWFDGTACKNGVAFTISYDLTGISLPDKVIVGVAYNTSHYGYSPVGETSCNASSGGCFYDSLNIGLGYPPSVGTDPLPDDVYQYSNIGGQYCDGGSAGTGTFRLDAGCWAGYQPTIKIEAQSSQGSTPTSVDQCKKGGWKNFNNPTFKNQGQCVSYVVKHNKPGKATGDIKMSNPKQRMIFSAFDYPNNPDKDKGNVEYWNFDYPGLLHYKAKVQCAFVDSSAKIARFMFQIPSGWPGLSGLYVVSYVKDGGSPGTKDSYGHTATADKTTALNWCENGPDVYNYPVVGGNLVVHK